MKKLLFLILLTLSLVSCKKEPDNQQLRFSPTPGSTEPLKFDSIAYTTIEYYDLTQTEGIHTVNLDIKTEYLNLKGGHSYSFEKFDMVGKSGEVMYFIPLEGDPGSDNISLPLPIHFTMPEKSGANLLVTVIRYPN